jgi:hypothetical protein
MGPFIEFKVIAAISFNGQFYRLESQENIAVRLEIFRFVSGRTPRSFLWYKQPGAEMANKRFNSNHLTFRFACCTRRKQKTAFFKGRGAAAKCFARDVACHWKRDQSSALFAENMS